MGAAGNSGYPQFYDDRAGYFDQNGKDLRVDVTDLQTYAENTRLELNNLMSNWAGGVVSLMGVTSTAFGLNGEFKEAAWTRIHHMGAMDAVGQLVHDLMLGMRAISVASMTIAAEYLTGDHEGADGFTVVNESFYPTDPNVDTLAKLDQQDQNGQGQGGPPAPPPSTPEPPRHTPGDHTPGESVSASNRPITVGSGKAEVTIPSDPLADAPDPKTTR